MTAAPPPPCPVCAGPAVDRLTVRYLYPRPAPIMEAVDPWNVHGSASLRTCGSLACQAAALLAVVDTIVVDTAVDMGHLLNPGDVEIVHVGRPGDLTGIAIADGGEDE